MAFTFSSKSLFDLKHAKMLIGELFVFVWLIFSPACVYSFTRYDKCHPVVTECPCGKNVSQLQEITVEGCLTPFSLRPKSCKPCPWGCDILENCQTCFHKGCLTCTEGKTGLFCNETSVVENLSTNIDDLEQTTTSEDSEKTTLGAKNVRLSRTRKPWKSARKPWKSNLQNSIVENVKTSDADGTIAVVTDMTDTENGTGTEMHAIELSTGLSTSDESNESHTVEQEAVNSSTAVSESQEETTSIVSQTSSNVELSPQTAESAESAQVTTEDAIKNEVETILPNESTVIVPSEQKQEEDEKILDNTNLILLAEDTVESLKLEATNDSVEDNTSNDDAIFEDLKVKLYDMIDKKYQLIQNETDKHETEVTEGETEKFDSSTLKTIHPSIKPINNLEHHKSKIDSGETSPIKILHSDGSHSFPHVKLYERSLSLEQELKDDLPHNADSIDTQSKPLLKAKDDKLLKIKSKTKTDLPLFKEHPDSYANIQNDQSKPLKTIKEHPESYANIQNDQSKPLKIIKEHPESYANIQNDQTKPLARSRNRNIDRNNFLYRTNIQEPSNNYFAHMKKKPAVLSKLPSVRKMIYDLQREEYVPQSPLAFTLINILDTLKILVQETLDCSDEELDSLEDFDESLQTLKTRSIIQLSDLNSERIAQDDRYFYSPKASVQSASHSIKDSLQGRGDYNYIHNQVRANRPEYSKNEKVISINIGYGNDLNNMKQKLRIVPRVNSSGQVKPLDLTIVNEPSGKLGIILRPFQNKTSFNSSIKSVSGVDVPKTVSTSEPSQPEIETSKPKDVILHVSNNIEDVVPDASTKIEQDLVSETSTVVVAETNETNSDAEDSNKNIVLALMSRRRRSLHTDWCPIPRISRNGDLECTVWSYQKTCVMKCHVGYSIENGTFHCSYGDSGWTPKLGSCKGKDPHIHEMQDPYRQYNSLDSGKDNRIEIGDYYDEYYEPGDFDGLKDNSLSKRR